MTRRVFIFWVALVKMDPLGCEMTPPRRDPRRVCRCGMDATESMCSRCGPEVDGFACDCEYDLLRCPAGHTWRMSRDDDGDDGDRRDGDRRDSDRRDGDRRDSDRTDDRACPQCRRAATGRRCSRHQWNEFMCNCVRDTFVCPNGHAWPAR